MDYIHIYASNFASDCSYMYMQFRGRGHKFLSNKIARITGNDLLAGVAVPESRVCLSRNISCSDVRTCQEIQPLGTNRVFDQ